MCAPVPARRRRRARLVFATVAASAPRVGRTASALRLVCVCCSRRRAAVSFQNAGGARAARIPLVSELVRRAAARGRARVEHGSAAAGLHELLAPLLVSQPLARGDARARSCDFFACQRVHRTAPMKPCSTYAGTTRPRARRAMSRFKLLRPQRGNRRDRASGLQESSGTPLGGFKGELRTERVLSSSGAGFCHALISAQLCKTRREITHISTSPTPAAAVVQKRARNATSSPRGARETFLRGRKGRAAKNSVLTSGAKQLKC